jgi:phospholipid transport system substrate-binding protein
MSQSSMIRLSLAATALAGVMATAAVAATADPAGQTIERLDDGLISAMKAGKPAGPQGRYKIMTPIVEQVFDLPTMVRFAVGPDWAKIAPADQTTLLAAFRRFTIANYAKNFDGYAGQKIVVQPDVQTRGLDKLVKTQMTGGGSDVTLSYRMRQSGDAWKVIDVYYNGAISQLTTQRSDFSAALASGGAKALIAKLDAQSDKLLK